MSSGPRISAVIPVIEVSTYARRCIDALLAFDGIEVVLVPDSCPADLDPRIVCIPSGAANTSRKRQVGLEGASAPYVALIDDDALPAEGWPDAAIAVLEADPSIGAVAGPTLTPPDEPELGELSFRIFASPLVTGPQRWRYAQVSARDVDDAPSVNMVMRRSDAEAIRFDTPWAFGEDTVVCERLLKRGLRIRYIPDLVVLHSRRPLWRAHLRQLYRWSRRRGAFARAGGINSRRPAYFAPTLLTAGIVSRPLLPTALRPLWNASAAFYLAVCAIAGRDRRPGRWWRISLGIIATHLAYGVGFALSLAGFPLPEDRAK